MTGAGRLGAGLAVAAALVAPSGAGATTSTPLDARAKHVSDTFAHALVVEHDLPAARAFASGGFAQLRALWDGFVREGVSTIVGPSRILRGCRLLSREPVSSKGDCVFYRLRGSRRSGLEERRSEGDFRVWLRPEPTGWKVWAYRYSARVTVCPRGCPG